MIKIGIVGPGYVGQGIYRLFGDWVQAMYSPSGKSVPDEFKEEIRNGTTFRAGRDTKEAINACDLVVICAPTPMLPDGHCDTSAVEDAVKWVECPAILIKSTIPPGTTDRLMKETGKKIAFSPEYMGEGGYFTPPWKYPDPKEMRMHTFQIFGGPRELTSYLIDVFIRKMGPHVFYAQTDAKTAEVVKYMENSWGAMKVIWANEWFEICKAHGVDYREARELWALDSRVEKMHTAVFSQKRGFGGKCFPKDVSAIIAHTKDKGYTPKIMEQVLKSNEEFVAMNEEGGEQNEKKSTENTG